ncbi:unnamed protein product [Musa hybrid cultivar]
MEGGCVEEASSDWVKRLHVSKVPQRIGSGVSVVLDPSAEGGGIEAESRKLSSSWYKGVVPQPNGRYGSQIYERHQRVWLGNFGDEAEAARAYDVAAQWFRGSATSSLSRSPTTRRPPSCPSSWRTPRRRSWTCCASTRTTTNSSRASKPCAQLGRYCSTRWSRRTTWGS